MLQNATPEGTPTPCTDSRGAGRGAGTAAAPPVGMMADIPGASIGSRATTARTHAFRILVAEDDVEMRHLVTDALREDGYDVVELADGGRLLVDIAARMKEGADGDAIDLIISDIRMPICTGLQILEALRLAHWHTPVILMTAFGDRATRKRAEDLVAVLFDKPFDTDDLRTAVARLLPRDRAF
jgi:two-component system, cell cycle response regulator CpdR